MVEKGEFLPAKKRNFPFSDLPKGGKLFFS
jgi:hypothetical protein